MRELQWCKEQQEQVDRAAKEAAAQLEAEEKQRRQEEMQKYER